MRSLYVVIIVVIGFIFIGLDSHYAKAITSNMSEIISKQGNESGITTLQTTNDSGNSIVAVDPNSNPSISSSIVLGSDSLPIIAYYDYTSYQLKVVHCGNIACSIGNTISAPVSENLILHQLDLAIGSDGFPIMSFQDFSGHLKVLHCGSVDCSQGNTLTVVDPNENVGQFLSLTIDSDGLPIMSYYDYPNQHLKIAYCSRIDCTEGNYIRTLDSKEYGGLGTSIAIGKDGFPVIAFSGLPIENPKIIHCLTVICAKTTVISVNQNMTMSAYPRSMAIGKDGLPVVSYYGGTIGGTFNLKVLHCGNPDCTENTLTTVDSSPDSGQRNLMVMDKNGLPIIVYLVTDPYGFKIVHCGNPECSAGNTWSTTNFTNVSDYSSMILGKDGFPIITGVGNSAGGPLIVVHCGKADCSSNNQTRPQLRENLDNTHAELWYIGKAAKQNMYVKYSIQDNDTNNGNPYEMTIYFKEYNSDKKYWD